MEVFIILITMKITDILTTLGAFPVGSVIKNPSANAGDTGDMDLIPGLGRSLRGGNGNPLQYPCLENLMDRGSGRLQSIVTNRYNSVT